MDLMGYILVGFVWCFYQMCEAQGTPGLALNASQIQERYCDVAVRKTVAATSKIETKAVILNPLTEKEIKLTKSKHSSRSPPCDIWTIKSEKAKAEITVIINDLGLFSKDIFCVVSESPRWTLSYDYNLTSDPDLHLFPKTVTSQSPLTLIWFHQSAAEEESHTKRQRLAFSYLTVGGTDEASEEKERVVLIGAISISIFTVIATLVSIVRSTKCCRCLCAFINISKWESRERTGSDENSSVDASTGRRTRRGAGNRDETVLLREIEVPRPALQSDHLGLLHPVGQTNDDDETSFTEVGRSRSNTAPNYYSTDEYESDYDHHLGDTANPTPGSVSRANDRHGIDSTDLRPTQTSLAAVLGMLPATSSDSALSSTRGSSALSSTTAPPSFPSSLLPAIRRHLARATSSNPPSSSSPPTASSALASPYTFSHLIQSETRPMSLSASSSSSPSRTRTNNLNQFYRLGYLRNTTRHVSPFDHNTGSPLPRTQATPPESQIEEAPPPPYSETPPPSYSSLFPENS